MEIYHSLAEVPDPEEMNVALTMGSFDGVHLGHQKILAKVASYREPGVQIAGVVTFDPHPLEIINPDAAPRLITPLKEKLVLLDRYRFSYVLVLPFDRQVCDMSHQDFVKEILVDKLGVKKLIVGHDVTFGAGAKGDGKYLETAGKEFGFGTEITAPVKNSGKVISSTAIRKLLQEKGDARIAQAMLGRPFRITGKVVKGLGLGKRIGVPTANIKTHPKKLIPLFGVYAAYALVDGKRVKSVMNIGVRPTIPMKKPSLCIEAHLLDFDGDLYDSEITVEFTRFIRPEKKFDNVKLLVAQMKKDIAIASTVLK